MIKKVYKYVLCSAALFFFATSCHFDSNTLTVHNSEIYGTWYLSKNVSKGCEFVLGAKKPSLTLNKDLTLSRKSELYPSTSGEGTYVYSESDNLLVVTIDGKEVSYTIKEVSSKSLVLIDSQNPDNETYYTR